MRAALPGLAVVCLLNVAPAFGGASVTVLLKETVVTEREQLKLADVAQVRAEGHWRARIENLGLGSAPRPGLERRFDRLWLAGLIREHYGRSLTLNVIGAERVTVKRTGVEYSAGTFVEPAREQLMAHLRARRPDLTRVELTPVGSPNLGSLPAGQLSVSVRKIRDTGLAKRMCVWVDAVVNGSAAGSLPIWFSVSAYRPVAVAVRDLGQHADLGNGEVRVEERDIAGLVGEPLAFEFDSGQLRVRHALPQGRLILASDVETRPSVLRNQQIQVQVKSGGVVIQTSGIAMSDAQIGDRVMVRNPDSQKTYVAQVVAEGEVMVIAQ